MTALCTVPTTAPLRNIVTVSRRVGRLPEPPASDYNYSGGVIYDGEVAVALSTVPHGSGYMETTWRVGAPGAFPCAPSPVRRYGSASHATCHEIADHYVYYEERQAYLEASRAALRAGLDAFPFAASKIR